MNPVEYTSLDATGLAALVRRREVSPVELLEVALARAHAVNPQINAVIRYMEDEARGAIDRGLPPGPFTGVPFLLKDLLAAYAGVPLQMGSRLFGDFVPDADSELVRRFKAAGLVVFGKTNTPEFGLSPTTEPVLHGVTRNPWNVERTPAGSSGGAGAAVAAHIVPMASGGDGGGSIRGPASANGLVGLKPSRGRNPSGPQDPDVWWDFTVEHVLTRTVRDSAAALDATAGDYPGQLMKLPPPAGRFLDEVGRAPGQLRVGVSIGPALGERIAPECVAAVQRTAERLAALGHDVEQVELPLARDEFVYAYSLLIAADTAALVRNGERLRGRRAAPGDLEPLTWAMRRIGDAVSGTTLTQAYWSMQLFARRWLEWAERYDVILQSTLSSPPVPIGSLQPRGRDLAIVRAASRLPLGRLLTRRSLLIDAARPAFNFSGQTMIANVTGQPAISLPLEWSGDGLPIGMMFTARTGDEATLLRLAGQLEAEYPWAGRSPPLADGSVNPGSSAPRTSTSQAARDPLARRNP
jgi:amidase